MRATLVFLFITSALFSRCQTFPDVKKNLVAEWQIDTTIQQHAVFEDGDAALLNLFVKNLVFPDTDDEACFFSQRIIIALLIDKNGCIEETRVVRSICHLLDKQFINLAKDLTFKPATKNGKPVRDLLYIPVTICLR